MTTLTSRVEGVLEKAKILDAYFEEHGVPYPSFDENALDQLPQELQGYRWAFANEANDLKKLMRGPLMTVLDTASNVSHDKARVAQCLSATTLAPNR